LITERRKEFAESDELNTDVTSGSSTTPTAFFGIRPANRFGFDVR
jgi:hypothetical protein